MDRLNKEHRSWNMSRIRGSNTKPELVVRSLLHRMGYRFRLHRRDLPGRPDIVLPKHKTVVQVHGCFWHRHTGCKMAYKPRTRWAFWKTKFAGNVERDQRTHRELQALGWRVIVIWECETRNAVKLEGILRGLLVSRPSAITPPTGSPLAEASSKRPKQQRSVSR
jgi:DNA mismatch endonuclease, patch repair protein